MPEYSYGIWRNWEFSLQLPTATTPGKSRLEGLRTELQYVAPHDGDDGWYWGFNVELTRSTRLAKRSSTNIEFTPIIGYRIDRWHFTANPGFEKALSGATRPTGFQPAIKAAYRAFDKNHFGIEYYVDAGPLRRPLPRDEQSRVLYLAWDGKLGKSDINVGVGHGITAASDRWVVKMVFEVAF